jgi:hypothetical protein
LPFVLFWGMVAIDRIADAVKTYRNGRMLVQCLQYRAPPDQVVFEQREGLVRSIVPAAPLVRYASWYGANPTVFLHERRGGNAKLYNRDDLLIAVQLEPHLMYTYDGRTVADRPVMCFYPWQAPARASASASTGLVSGSDLLVILPQMGDDIRVYAGQPDASDPTKFAFDVSYNGVRQMVSGSVANGLIHFKPQAGQIYAPASWAHAKFWVPQGATAAQVQSTLQVIQSTGQPSPTTWRSNWNQPLVPQTTQPAIP